MRKFLVLGLMVLPLLVVGCSKGPAEAALKAADEAIAKVAPDAQKFVPDQFKALTDAAAAAKASFDKGDYAAALAAAKDLPAKANDVMAAAATKRDELTGLWNRMAEALPAEFADLTAKINAIAAMKKLPKGVDAAELEASKAGLADITELWIKASKAYTDGDVKGAVEMARDVKTKTDALVVTLAGITAPAPKK
jgi:hypothetical protein